jgi:AraC family transcriptional regulator of arabinose operon
MATAMTQRSRSGRTIFAGHFVEGPGYHTRRPHGTDDWLIVLTLAGRGRFGYDGGENFVHERDLTLIRPGTMHDYGVEPELQHWEMLWCHFLPRPHWMDLLDWPEISPGTMNFHLSDPSIRQRITARFDDCVRLANGPLRRRDELAMNALEEVLLWADLENPRTQSSNRAVMRAVGVAVVAPLSRAGGRYAAAFHRTAADRPGRPAPAADAAQHQGDRRQGGV